ncbi:hypothetical protein [Mucilaginibacter sp.]|uniref:hypothetical protein n=1 Tax=Mucilaginibacter sp. TaxID=1882438 RepID=UPI003D10098E
MVTTIKSVSIKLDEIIVVNKDNQSFKINIADFIEYNDRLKIKSNFEKLAASVASQQDYVA